MLGAHLHIKKLCDLIVANVYIFELAVRDEEKLSHSHELEN